MLESLQEEIDAIDAVIARNDFIFRKIEELAQAPWPEQFQFLYAYMQAFDTEIDNQVENQLLCTLNHPYIKALLQNAYLMLAKAAYDEKIGQPQGIAPTNN